MTNDWYAKFKSEGSYDSNYYYKLVAFFKEWILGYDDLLRSGWIRITDKATKDPAKFIWHLKFHEIIRLNALPACEADKQYRILLDEWENPKFFKIFLDYDTVRQLEEKARDYRPVKPTNSIEETTKIKNDKGRTSEQLSING